MVEGESAMLDLCNAEQQASPKIVESRNLLRVPGMGALALLTRYAPRIYSSAEI